MIVRPVSKKILNSNHSILSKINKQLLATAAQVKHHELKTYDDIPGPKKLPFLGTVVGLKGFGGDIDPKDFRSFQSKLQERYGDLVRWEIFSKKMVFVFNPEHIKMVFKADPPAPIRSEIEPLLKLHAKIGISKTLLNSQNERWRKLRTASNPILARPQTIHSYVNNQSEVGNELINIINQRFKSNENKIEFKEFDKILRLLALEYVSEIVFNQRLKCVDEKTRLSDVTELVNNIDQFLILMGRLSFGIPVWKYVPTKDSRDFEKVGTYVYNIVRKYIQEAQNNLASSGKGKKTILGQFLERKDKYGIQTTDVVAIMTDLLIAGVDTTATSLYFLLYELGRNHQVQQELYEEINRVVGDNKNVSEDHIEKLKFLKNCVKESLRIHNNAPANGRVLASDLVLGDYLIPKGTQMLLSTTYITKSERFFKNPLKFDPHRWNRSDQGSELIDPYANLPFGFGARMCIGRRIAEQEIYLTIIKLLQNYKIEYKGATPGIKLSVILSPDIPLDIHFIRRY